MKLALAQVSTTVGDVAGNVDRLERAIARAALLGAEVALLPEMALTGYPPRDLLLDPGLVRAARDGLARLARAAHAVAPGLVVVVGAPVDGPPGPTGRRLRNAAVVLHGGRVVATRGKALLPCDDVFLEPRWFTPDDGPARPVELPLRGGARRVGLLVCEDLWDEAYARAPARELLEQGADALLCLNASPYRAGVRAERLRLARRPQVPLAYVNAVGGEDELVFDGASFAVDARGRLLAALPACEEAVALVDLDAPGALADDALLAPDDAATREALVLGLADFCRKNRLPGAVVGVSGGVDSALVLALAADALGPARVTAVHLPSRFTSRRSTDDARALCAALGVRLDVVALEPLHAAAAALLEGCLPGGLGATGAENVQARLRALVLMGFVNRLGGLLLNTSNKTELALGYGTLYGDMAGGLAPIADLTKLDVWRLAAADPRVPRAIVERTPTAELAPDQVDPFDYPRVAPAIEALVLGDDQDVAPDLAVRVARAEFKRRQAPPGLKVTARAFGPGRLVPITWSRWPTA
ncbi:MAG: NAD(+) synthase [Planctomycetes bacterium]|nr:NAD(+) synthase [Planctomycetota bacterium]